MSGLTFVRTTDLKGISKFYMTIIGMKLWVEQPDINILQSDNFLVGFHEQDTADADSMLTFFYSSTEEVDEMYEMLSELGIAISEPKENKKYNIYNFFAKDPDGRTIEFQKFLHPLPAI